MVVLKCLKGRGRLRGSFKPYTHHCLTVQVTSLEICKSMGQIIGSAEDVHVHMGLHLVCNAGCADSKKVMTDVMIRELIGHVTLQST